MCLCKSQSYSFHFPSSYFQYIGSLCSELRAYDNVMLKLEGISSNCLHTGGGLTLSNKTEATRLTYPRVKNLLFLIVRPIHPKRK